MQIIDNLQPTLQDDFILIRPLQESDFEKLYTISNDPLLWEQHPCKDRYKRDVFEVLFAEAVECHTSFAFIEKASGETFGSSRYKWYEESKELEIGWTFIGRQYWGGKYNSAVKKLMLDHAFTLVDKVIFHAGVSNFRSQKAILKLGAKQIGTIHMNGRESAKFILGKENLKLDE